MKKFIAAVVSAFMLTSAMMTAYANNRMLIESSGVYIDETFTRPETELENPLWAPEGWVFAGITDTEIETVHSDGYVQLEQNFGSASAQIQYPLASKAIPENFTLMYDVYFAEDNERGVYIPTVVNGYDLGLNASGSFTYIDGNNLKATLATGTPQFDTWYTYVFQVKKNQVTIFKKSENDSEFSKVGENLTLQTSTSANTIRIYAISSNTKAAGARLDNVKLFSGTYLIDSDITINDEKTMITGTMNIGNADVAIGSSRNVRIIMSAYDKRGKILKMAMNPSDSITFGENNNLTIQMPLNEILYNALKGGTVELYLWNSVSGAVPLCDIHKIEVQ